MLFIQSSFITTFILVQPVPHPLVTRQSRMIEQSEMTAVTATSSRGQPFRDFQGHSNGCTATTKGRRTPTGFGISRTPFCSLCSSCLKQISIVRLKNSMVIVNFTAGRDFLPKRVGHRCISCHQLFAIDEKKLRKLQHAQKCSMVLSWNSGECDYQSNADEALIAETVLSIALLQ